jgi:peptide/nickel transport system permease protein
MSLDVQPPVEPGPPTSGSRKERNILIWTGGTIVGVMIVGLYLGAALISTSTTAQDLGNAFAGPSREHLLGTDQLGRDLLARLVHGGRTDVTIALVAVVVPMISGTVIGAVAGYVGGWVDAIIMRVADVVSAFPFYVLVIALVFVLGTGALSIFVAISVVSWVAYARIVRAETVVLREKDFIAACRTSGLPAWRIVARHVIPNTVSQAILFAVSDIVLNLGVIVTLSYFGLGITPPTPDWGQIMNDGQQYLSAGRYSLTLMPGIAIVVLGLGLACLGEGLARRVAGRSS